MQTLFDIDGGVRLVLPLVLTLFFSALVLRFADWLLFRRPVTGFLEARVVRQLLMLVLTTTLLILVLFTLPFDNTAREQLLRVLGLLLTGVVAFASTSFVSNAMAGVMLRAVRNFSLGDFIGVNGHFGRVTERGLFHTEIQTEDRDLTTLPNLLLVTNPVKVVRSSGTIISINVSLGYDVPRQKVEPLLITAAEAADLEGAYVQIRDLLDHAIVYRVAGFLRDVTKLLSAGSRLRASTIDHLHTAGIEIASPTLINQRRLAANVPILSDVPESPAGSLPAKPNFEKLAFDKAERAAEKEKLRGQLADIDDKINALKKAEDETEADTNQRDIDRLSGRRDHVAGMLAALEQAPDE